MTVTAGAAPAVATAQDDDSRFKRGLIRATLATAFLSGIDLLAPLGAIQITHVVLALLLILTTLASRRPAPGGLVVLFYALTGASILLIVATSGTFGAAGDRVLSTLPKVLLAVLILAAYHAAYTLAGRDIARFFEHYLRVAYFFAALGVLQQVVFIGTRIDIFGFLLTGAKDYGTYLGVSALSVEPAFYACALLPAAAWHVSRFVSLLSISRAGAVTIGAVVFSTSSVGYIGLAAAAAITAVAGLSARRAWVVVVTLPLAFLAGRAMLQTEFVQLRLNDSLRLLDTGVGAATGTNLSSYSLAVNADMAFRSLVDNYGAGAGFGLYGTVYDYYIGDYAGPIGRNLPGRGSATSFLFRMVGELGLLGIAIILWLVRGFVVAIKRGTHRAIAIACLATFSVILLRMGEYYDNGVLFVLLLAFLLSRPEPVRQPASR